MKILVCKTWILKIWKYLFAIHELWKYWFKIHELWKYENICMQYMNNEKMKMFVPNTGIMKTIANESNGLQGKKWGNAFACSPSYALCSPTRLP